ncbi:hypothetical protein [Algoriphagus resistens]|uniref:hypothetical protein n=1 Tax=Algoriphagus resistens TaxID=1750590 RepID=UPI0007168DF6|nr:hypothetical protein [Algoriphagus resistens]
MIGSRRFWMEKMRYGAMLFLFSGLSIACNNSEDMEDQVGNTNPFIEGKLTVSVDMVNNPMYDIYKHLDLEAGNVSQQMEDIMEGLGEEEKSDIQEFLNALEDSNPGNLGYTFSMLFHAINSKEIVVQDLTKATTKYNTLQYHGEIQFNTANQEGMLYMMSHSNSDKELTFSYSNELYLEGGPQTVLTGDGFDILRTDETAIVAGYLCKKVVYSLKDGGGGAGGFLKVEAWTSDLIPNSINYVMPYLLDEQQGILKMAIHHISNENYPVVYEVTDLNPRQVGDEEVSIRQSDPQYSFPEDEAMINSILLDILFQE